VRKAYQLLAASLDAAVNDGLIARTPCRGIALPKVEHHEMRFLNPTEVAGLADAINPRYRALVLTAAYTGLRAGECAALKLPRLNLLQRQLTVAETLSDVRGHLRFTPPKTKAARRSVTLPASLCDELARHLSHYPTESLVFTAAEGEPIRWSNLRRRTWQPATEAVGLDGLRFHDLRHTHAALLIAAGEHPKVIQARLGHASIGTTLDTYGHLFEGLDEAAADRLDATWREQAVS
jgi:integrase